MRILHVDSGRAWRGGQAQVGYLLAGLVARGHDTWLAAPAASPLHERLCGRGVITVPVAMRGDLDLGAVMALADVARRSGAEVIHAHSAGAHGLAVGAARLAAVPWRVVTRRLDLPVGRSPFSRWKYGRGVSRYVAISRRVADSLAAGGVDPERISVVYSGIPVSNVPRVDDPAARAAARAILLELVGEAAAQTPLLGSIGALSPQKGHDLALRALASIPAPARLVIVGEGEERARLETLARETGVAGRVTWAGFRPDVAALLPGFDLILAPSRHEGLGTAVLEAMAAGLPIVASRVCEFPEMLMEGRAGILVPAEDAGALGQAARELLADPGRRADLGRAARRRAEDYAVERMIEGNLDVYEGLIASPPPGVGHAAGTRRDGHSSTGG